MPLRVKRTVKCHNCQNDNLLHGLSLAKATQVMMIGGPSQLPNFVGERWAVYYCIACQSFFPYPKSYSANPQLQSMYKKILSWCIAQAEIKKQQNKHLETMISIIESNKDLLGLPGKREDNLEKALGPIMDRIDDLESSLRAKKGGRPKHCKIKDCKEKSQLEGYCKAHFMEKNNE